MQVNSCSASASAFTSAFTVAVAVPVPVASGQLRRTLVGSDQLRLPSESEQPGRPLAAGFALHRGKLKAPLRAPRLKPLCAHHIAHDERALGGGVRMCAALEPLELKLDAGFCDISMFASLSRQYILRARCQRTTRCPGCMYIGVAGRIYIR